MPDLSRVDAFLADALARLHKIDLRSTQDINDVELLRAQCREARDTLAAMRSRGEFGSSTSTDARYAAAFNHALDGMLIANDLGEYVDANPAACRMVGYSREELMQLSVRDLTPEPQRAQFAELWAEFLTAQTMSGEYSLRTKSGTIIVVAFRAVANILPGQHLSVLHPKHPVVQATTGAA
jgi:PAS domain S-box-containing protein